MNPIERLGLFALHRLDPERAHRLSIWALNAGLVPLPGHMTTPRLQTNIAGIAMPNPIGLAAGFDKNAEAIHPLSRAGFGFIELGAATPRPQSGNPRPRLFRLTQDRAVINRFGFNNDGMAAITARLQATPVGMPRGLNLGANKDSRDRAQDYVDVLRMAGPHLDFATVNVSSPNTEKLRDLQGKAALSALLTRVMEARAELADPIPVFLKIAPDLSDREIAEIAEVAVECRVQAVIATNTTLARDGLMSSHAAEAGGLSGTPLFQKATRVLARLAHETVGALPLIGVGGIDSAETAYQKIKAGASAVQLYSALVYHGMSLVPRIVHGLDALLKRDGFEHIRDAIGIEKETWK